MPQNEEGSGMEHLHFCAINTTNVNKKEREREREREREKQSKKSQNISNITSILKIEHVCMGNA